MDSMHHPRLPASWAAACGLALAATATVAQDNRTPCKVEEAKKEWTIPSGWLNAIRTNRCSSVVTVVRQIASTTRTGGRKLEGDKPLNLREAEQERTEAHADPFIRSELEAEQQGESDPLRKLLLEAAVLHDNGFLKARDLVLMQLRTESAK